MAEARGHMAFSIDPSGKYFRHCAFKCFEYQLTAEHCTPSPGYQNEIHIFMPNGGEGKRQSEASDAPLPLPLGAPEGERALSFEGVTDSAFDRNGVLYSLGVSWGTAKYANPADSGAVSVGWSSDAANYYSTAGGHKVGDAKQAARVICTHTHPGANATMWSKGSPNAYFEIDLRSVTLKPTHYAYRNDYGGGGNHPRTYELQGSTNGREWVTLRKHSGEVWKGNCAKAWTIDGATDYYRLFRVQNLGSPNHLCCSGIEFYGLVRGAPAAAPAKAATAPVVMGTAIEDCEVANGTPVRVVGNSAVGGAGASSSSTASAAADMPLYEIAEVLQRELGVKGSNLQETIDAAVSELGLTSEAGGLNLIEKARLSMEVLGSRL